MKSAWLVGPEEYEIRDIPEPELPDDGLILKINYCGVCGSDLRRWRGGPPAGSGGVIPGHEASGVVEKVGKNLKGYAAGDRLAVAPDIHCGSCYYCIRGMYNICDNMKFLGMTAGYPGAFAEKMVLTGEALVNGVIHQIPEGMDLLDAAVSEPSSSVLASHEKACTGPSDVVVVMGAGPIGCIHIAVSHARGARVILSEPVDRRREMAAAFEPEMIVDPFTEDLEVAVRGYTNGVGADMVVCANPIKATQTQAVEIVRKAGRVVLFGGVPKDDPMTSLNSNTIHYGDIEVVGAFSYHPTMHELALSMIYRGLIPADKLITHTMPLEKVAEAFEIAASGDALKVVITTEQ